jgi:predicted phage replisome organizer
MSDNKKYYYLRLKENFFDSDSMIVLESMQDGYLYSNILLKLYLRSLKNEGKLMFNEKIPYNPTMLASITRHQVGTVEKAVQIFEDLGLIELLNNGAIYISEIQDFIGKTTTEADRKRAYRSQIEDEKMKLNGQMSRQISDKSMDKTPPEKELELELELELNKDIELAPKKASTITVFDYYLSLELKNHRNYTDAMKRAVEKAVKENKYSIDECKILLDRHKEVVRVTKRSSYQVRVRGLDEFFGQKVKDSIHLICSEYEEGGAKYEKYLKGKGVNKVRKEVKIEIYDDII